MNTAELHSLNDFQAMYWWWPAAGGGGKWLRDKSGYQKFVLYFSLHPVFIYLFSSFLCPRNTSWQCASEFQGECLAASFVVRRVVHGENNNSIYWMEMTTTKYVYAHCHLIGISKMDLDMPWVIKQINIQTWNNRVGQPYLARGGEGSQWNPRLGQECSTRMRIMRMKWCRTHKRRYTQQHSFRDCCKEIHKSRSRSAASLHWLAPHNVTFFFCFLRCDRIHMVSNTSPNDDRLYSVLEETSRM